MKNNLIITLIAAGLLFGQTQDQIKQAKDVIKSTGMSEAQAKAAAEAQAKADAEAKAKAAAEKAAAQAKEATEAKAKDSSTDESE